MQARYSDLLPSNLNRNRLPQHPLQNKGATKKETLNPKPSTLNPQPLTLTTKERYYEEAP